MTTEVLPEVAQVFTLAPAPTRGYFYIAINDSSTGQLVYSAKRLHEVDPDTPISVVTDCPIPDEDKHLFDQIITVPHQIDLDGFRELPAYPHQGLMGKVRYFYQSPYDVTLFLDCDTYAVEKFSEIFDLAEDYDLAGSHCSGHFNNGYYPDVPEAFTIINTGVILYRRCPVVASIMSEWWDNMATHKDPWSDQPFFQKSLWDHRNEVKFLTLPYEYNFRFIFPMYAHGRVKILHGRFDGVNEAAKIINNYQPGSRVFYWNDFVCRYDPQKGLIINADHKLRAE